MKGLLILLSILVTACTIPKEYLQNDNTCHYNDSIFSITKKEMILDVEKYRGKLTQTGIIIREDSLVEERIYKWNDSDNITNKQTNKQTNIEKTIKYNSRGKILFSYFQHNNGDVYIGKETHYDTEGNITQVIDHEAGYRICWAEALAIVNRKLKKGYGNPALGRSQRIQNGDTLRTWNVFVVKEATHTRPRDVKLYEVNAQTGKIRIKNVTYSDTALPLPEDWEDWRKN